MHLTLWYVVLVCHQFDVCRNYIGSVYVGGYGGLSISGLYVFGKLCPVGFLVVCKCSSIFLQYCCCCRPTHPCLFGDVLLYFEITGHPVPVYSLRFKCPDCFIWNCSYIVYPSKKKGPFRDNCLRYYYICLAFLWRDEWKAFVEILFTSYQITEKEC